MSCPNSDPNFNKILAKFNSDNPEKRKFIFYFICIVIRLLLYSFIYVNIENKYTIPIVALLALASVYNLRNNLNDTQQWWSKKYQFIIALLIFIFSIIIMTDTYALNKKIIPILLFTSLFGGIFQSMLVDFC